MPWTADLMLQCGSISGPGPFAQLLFYRFHASDRLLTHKFQNFYTDPESVPWTADLMLQCGSISGPGPFAQLLFYRFYASDRLLTHKFQYFYTDPESVPWTADLMLQCGSLLMTWTICPNFHFINLMLVTD